MHAVTRHHGKFEANPSPLMAEVVSNRMNNGCADTLGECEGFGFFALVTGKRYSFILNEDSQGFVTVEPFYEQAQATKEWDKLVGQYEEFCGANEDY